MWSNNVHSGSSCQTYNVASELSAALWQLAVILKGRATREGFCVEFARLAIHPSNSLEDVDLENRRRTD